MLARFMFLAAIYTFFFSAWTTATAADKPTQYRVPYRIDRGNHIAVRIKVNGEGPFWFVVDTGAPGFVISPAQAARLGIKGDKDRWGVTQKLEIEGGPVLENLRTAIVPGIPDGVGMLGYTALAHFRIEFDIHRDYMVLTKKDWQPPRPLTRRELGIKEPIGFGGAGGGAGGGAAPAAYIGVQPDPSSSPIKVVAVVPNSPAQQAGMQAGDVILQLNGQELTSPMQMMRQLSSVKVGDEVKLKIERNGRAQNITVVAASRANLAGAGGARGGGGGLGGMLGNLSPSTANIGYIGVEFDPIAPPCKIAAVHAGSPADVAGIKAGDVVTELNSRAVRSPDDIARMSGVVRDGAEITFTIERNGQQQTINVKAASGF